MGLSRSRESLTVLHGRTLLLANSFPSQFLAGPTLPKSRACHSSDSTRTSALTAALETFFPTKKLGGLCSKSAIHKIVLSEPEGLARCLRCCLEGHSQVQRGHLSSTPNSLVQCPSMQGLAKGGGGRETTEPSTPLPHASQAHTAW